MTGFGQAFCVEPYGNWKEVLQKPITNENLTKESKLKEKYVAGEIK